ncbi:hypothetical protein JJE66_34240 [Bradyrhizobium diazoefficiens]|uniref:hypothetical protein n=1 Tax=Bradyrhizobium diazoefficiens TaxID=1355477 RepID=UPI00190BCAB1|nr:hypothetical protein [Bradyrhizobium diazoefficiens]MBK3666265.1 hypothetical protein [Bradyrhizobium diazoefficiens]
MLAFVLTGCAESETRSVISSELPSAKYRRISVFIENSNPAQPRTAPSVQTSAGGAGGFLLIIPSPNPSSTDAEIEQKIVAALDAKGVKAGSGPAMFGGRSLTDQAKANIIQRNFDAVLYVTVLTNGYTEEQVAGASHNGQLIKFAGLSPEPITEYHDDLILKPDGTVWHNVPTFQAKCDLQDTKTNKVVWSSETIATGGTLVVMSRAADQIVSKLRADGVI